MSHRAEKRDPSRLRLFNDVQLRTYPSESMLMLTVSAHELILYTRRLLAVSCQNSVKRNDKQASIEFSTSSTLTITVLLSLSVVPRFYVVIASGMSPVHELSLSEIYRICLKGRRCSFPSFIDSNLQQN